MDTNRRNQIAAARRTLAALRAEGIDADERGRRYCIARAERMRAAFVSMDEDALADEARSIAEQLRGPFLARQ